MLSFYLHCYYTLNTHKHARYACTQLTQVNPVSTGQQHDISFVYIILHTPFIGIPKFWLYNYDYKHDK